MIRVTRIARVAGVCALVLSALAVSVAPAGAEIYPTATGSVTDLGDGTATITYSDTTDVEVYIIDGESEGCEDNGSAPTTGVLATLGVVNAMPASPVTVTTETQVGPLPLHALGTGSFFFCMYNVVGGNTYNWLNTTGGTIGIYPPASASMVDNGNGTLTLTWNADENFSQSVTFLMLSGVTICPAGDEALSLLPTLSGYAMYSGEAADSPYGNYALPPSPGTIGVGNSAIVLPINVGEFTVIPTIGPMTAGQYLACVYTSENGEDMLAQSMPMGLGIVPEPVVPVVPAFTG
jgi:hypothetical protein